jgi:hypothetical protein
VDDGVLVSVPDDVGAGLDAGAGGVAVSVEEGVAADVSAGGVGAGGAAAGGSAGAGSAGAGVAAVPESAVGVPESVDGAAAGELVAAGSVVGVASSALAGEETPANTSATTTSGTPRRAVQDVNGLGPENSRFRARFFDGSDGANVVR